MDASDAFDPSSFDSTRTMYDIATADPTFAEFLVSKGFPFSTDNPITHNVTFDDVVELRGLDRDAFLGEYARFRASRAR